MIYSSFLTTTSQTSSLVDSTPGKANYGSIFVGLVEKFDHSALWHADQHEIAPHVSTGVAKAVSNVKDICQRWMKCCDKKQKEPLPKDIEELSSPDLPITHGIEHTSDSDKSTEPKHDCSEHVRSHREHPDDLNGLVNVLFSFAKATDETKLLFEYGNRLQVNLSGVPRNPGFECFIRPDTWQDIINLMKDEDQATLKWHENIAEAEEAGLPMSPPPCRTTHQAMRAAARIAGRDKEQLIWEVNCYAERCGWAHIGAVQSLIVRERWRELATKLYNDFVWLRRDTRWTLTPAEKKAKDHTIRALEALRDEYFDEISCGSSDCFDYSNEVYFSLRKCYRRRTAHCSLAIDGD